jgi:hypothetical protein
MDSCIPKEEEEEEEEQKVNASKNWQTYKRIGLFL